MQRRAASHSTPKVISLQRLTLLPVTFLVSMPQKFHPEPLFLIELVLARLQQQSLPTNRLHQLVRRFQLPHLQVSCTSTHSIKTSSCGTATFGNRSAFQLARLFLPVLMTPVLTRLHQSQTMVRRLAWRLVMHCRHHPRPTATTT